MTWRSHLRLRSSSAHVQLPFREPTDAEVDGTAAGAQRLAGTAIYDRLMPGLLAELKAEGAQRAEVQAIVLDEYALIGIPAELFVELGLAIKERAYPVRALIAGLANGMVGYVPHREAFARGGYETTFGDVSKLAPPAGDMLVEAGLAALEAALEAHPRLALSDDRSRGAPEIPASIGPGTSGPGRDGRSAVSDGTFWRRCCSDGMDDGAAAWVHIVPGDRSMSHPTRA